MNEDVVYRCIYDDATGQCVEDGVNVDMDETHVKWFSSTHNGIAIRYYEIRTGYSLMTSSYIGAFDANEVKNIEFGLVNFGNYEDYAKVVYTEDKEYMVSY